MGMKPRLLFCRIAQHLYCALNSEYAEAAGANHGLSRLVTACTVVGLQAVVKATSQSVYLFLIF